jgi:hypothetical protein
VEYNTLSIGKKPFGLVVSEGVDSSGGTFDYCYGYIEGKGCVAVVFPRFSITEKEILQNYVTDKRYIYDSAGCRIGPFLAFARSLGSRDMGEDAMKANTSNLCCHGRNFVSLV